MYTAKYFSNLFTSYGVPANIVPYLVAQVAHETANFTDHKIYDHNNASGITFAGQPNASRGNVLPETKNSSKPVYYARFATLKDWLRDYIRQLNKGANKPLQANNLNEFVTRLKANGYFTDKPENYLKRLQAYIVKYGGKIEWKNNIVPIVAGVVILYLLLSRSGGSR